MMEKHASPKIILLKSADDEISKVEPAIVNQMKTVQSFIETDNASMNATPFPLPNVFSPQLIMIIIYLKHHNQGASKKFSTKFMKGVSKEELRDLLLAADYQNRDSLLDFLTKVAVDYLAIDGFLDSITQGIVSRIQKKHLAPYSW